MFVYREGCVGRLTRRSLNTNYVLFSPSRFPAPRSPSRAPTACPSTISRMTAAQVIAQGDYLKPDFDPSSLTIPQLLGVFGFHNINYPSQYTKAKLVQIFNDDIKPKAKKFIKERLKRENSQASEDGITDGVTGKPLKEPRVCTRASALRPPCNIVATACQAQLQTPLQDSRSPRTTRSRAKCSCECHIIP